MVPFMGDLKKMKWEWLRGTSYQGYGSTLTVGVGIPIPILDEEICRYTAVKDEDIFAAIVDYGDAYPNVKPGSLGEVSYAQLKTGEIEVNGQKVPAGPLSSYSKAVEIAETLKEWIARGEFTLSEPVDFVPGPESDCVFKSLPERPVE